MRSSYKCINKRLFLLIYLYVYRITNVSCTQKPIKNLQKYHKVKLFGHSPGKSWETAGDSRMASAKSSLIWVSPCTKCGYSVVSWCSKVNASLIRGLCSVLPVRQRKSINNRPVLVKKWKLTWSRFDTQRFPGYWHIDGVRSVRLAGGNWQCSDLDRVFIETW